MSNTLQINVTTIGLGKNTRLSVDIRTGITLDHQHQLVVGNRPWRVSRPEYENDPVISRDNRRVLDASFFRIGGGGQIIAAPLVSDEKLFVSRASREVLISFDKVIPNNVLFCTDVYEETVFEGNDFLNRHKNPQLHDASSTGHCLLLRMEPGQFVRFWTRWGSVAFGMTSEGRIHYTFGLMLKEDFIILMQSSYEALFEERENHFEMVNRRLEEQRESSVFTHLFEGVEGNLKLKSLPDEWKVSTPVAEETLPPTTTDTGRRGRTSIVPRRKKAPQLKGKSSGSFLDVAAATA